MKVLLDTHAFLWWVLDDDRAVGQADEILARRSTTTVRRERRVDLGELADQGRAKGELDLPDGRRDVRAEPPPAQPMVSDALASRWSTRSERLVSR